MLRSIAAVITGFVTFAALAFGADAVLRHVLPRVFTPGGAVGQTGALWTILAYTALFMVIGAYVAARVARSHPVRHACILGGMVFVLTLGASVAMWGVAPAWYHVSAALLVLPCAWLGGLIVEARNRRDAGRS